MPPTSLSTSGANYSDFIKGSESIEKHVSFHQQTTSN